jgi:hypothetical protein
MGPYPRAKTRSSGAGKIASKAASIGAGYVRLAVIVTDLGMA